MLRPSAYYAFLVGKFPVRRFTNAVLGILALAARDHAARWRALSIIACCFCLFTLVDGVGGGACIHPPYGCLATLLAAPWRGDDVVLALSMCWCNAWDDVAQNILVTGDQRHCPFSIAELLWTMRDVRHSTDVVVYRSVTQIVDSKEAPLNHPFILIVQRTSNATPALTHSSGGCMSFPPAPLYAVAADIEQLG